MSITKSLEVLKGKNVEIIPKAIGIPTGIKYTGVVVALYIDQQCTFIELDTGELINTRYIATIKIQNN